MARSDPSSQLLGKQFDQYFNHFKAPAVYKHERAQCRHCKMTLRNSAPRRNAHLRQCRSLQMVAQRGGSSSVQPKTRNGAASKLQTTAHPKNKRKRFIIYSSDDDESVEDGSNEGETNPDLALSRPTGSGLTPYECNTEPQKSRPGKQSARRKECYKCRKRFSLSALEDHRATCLFERCGSCRQRKIPRSEMATHRCNQQFCSKCRKHVPISTFDEHHASCTLRKCNGCNTAGIPESEFAAHRLSCTTIRCPGCCQTFSSSVYLDHIALCEVRRCYRCFQPKIPQSEMAAHLIVCPMRRCPRCCKTFSKSAYDAHLAICTFRVCLNCRKGRIPAPDFAAHRLNCSKRHCSRCEKIFLESEYGAHRASCDLHTCTRCNKSKLPALEFEIHRKECAFKRCRHCCKSRIPKAEFVSHRKACSKRRCARCGEKEIPVANYHLHRATVCRQFQRCYGCTKVFLIQDYSQHIQSCQLRSCRVCQKNKIPISDMEEHLENCNFIDRCYKCNWKIRKGVEHVCTHRRCPHCRKTFHVTELQKHLSICEGPECNICHRRFGTSAAFRQHRQESGFLDLIGPLPQPSIQVLKPLSDVRARIHSPKTQFPKTAAIQRVMEDWYENPWTTIIVDCEYWAFALDDLASESVFEIAIANALDEWVVPPTVIDHCLSVSKMADEAYDAWVARQQDVPDSARYKQVAAWWSCETSIAKYYSPNVRQQRPFSTWKQVGDMIRAYTQKHGKLRNVLEWGSNYGDYQCLEAGMRKAESLDLLPPKPLWDTRPLSWWSNIRAQLGLRSQDLSLSLGKLYQLVFPERTALIGQWHNAGPDVRMTIQLIKFYFQRMSNAPTKGKMTAYFAPLGAEEVLDIKSDEESEGDWESDVDDDRDSDLSDEGSDMGDEVWNIGEDFFLSEEEYDMKDEILNAASGVSDAGGLDDY